MFDEECMPARRFARMETDLRQARNTTIFYNYQPIVALDDFHVCGFERCPLAASGARLISPQDFIRSLRGRPDSKNRTMVRDKLVYQAKRWQEKFRLMNLYMTVNLSAKQFAQPDCSTR